MSDFTAWLDLPIFYASPVHEFTQTKYSITNIKPNTLSIILEYSNLVSPSMFFVKISLSFFTYFVSTILTISFPTFSLTHLYLLSTCLEQLVVVILHMIQCSNIINSHCHGKLNWKFHASQQLSNEHYLFHSLQKCHIFSLWTWQTNAFLWLCFPKNCHTKTYRINLLMHLLV